MTIQLAGGDDSDLSFDICMSVELIKVVCGDSPGVGVVCGDSVDTACVHCGRKASGNVAAGIIASGSGDNTQIVM